MSAPGSVAYSLIPQPPAVADYLRLREAAGLHTKNASQALGAVEGSWAFCHVHDSRQHVVAMGRAIGDGGWYFHFADIVTAPQHRCRGLGGQVVTWLLDQIHDRAPSGAYVSLTASGSGSKLFRRFGFEPVVLPQGLAMQIVLTR